MSAKQQVSRVEIGDVFAIPLGDGRAALGYVIGKHKSAFYAIVLDLTVPEDALQDLDLSNVAAAPPLIARITFDARSQPGTWRIVATAGRIGDGSWRRSASNQTITTECR
ncbi:Imm26 family immunity protein [Curtobacterium pusillum]|uniref:Imm26 family immunity protein n=1 Tax=Curtobacterium pusillum TaxID=69373 RepID=UPI001643EAAB|nr:Imm26 family immunity protein [Curtobacterium pusillum]